MVRHARGWDIAPPDREGRDVLGYGLKDQGYALVSRYARLARPAR